MTKDQETFHLHSSKLINRIINWDFKHLTKSYKFGQKYTQWVRLFSFFGSFPAYLVVMCFFYFYGDHFNISKYRYFSLMLFTAGVVMSLLIVSIPKYILKRKRPYMDERIESYYKIKVINRDPEFGGQQQSFPSGHVYFWTFQAIIIGFHFNIWIAIPIYLTIPLMMFARMHLGCHFPSDVVIGAIFGVLSAIITIVFFYSFFYPSYLIVWSFLMGRFF
ncbi:MAG: phosphatase PAP2 family protein [Candidatus Lokiarchaeota archaeon]|nr:phosphatase PAP2 family protein [Candidatus Lokiarchaeota archaeon]